MAGSVARFANPDSGPPPSVSVSVFVSVPDTDTDPVPVPERADHVSLPFLTPREHRPLRSDEPAHRAQERAQPPLFGRV